MTNQDQVQSFYADMTAETIFESFRINKCVAHGNVIKIYRAFTTNVTIKYRDLEITSAATKDEIREMIGNFTLLEMRELLIVCATKADVSDISNFLAFDRSRSPSISPLKRLKIAIDVLTSTIQLYSDQNVQQIQNLTTENNNLKKDNVILQEKINSVKSFLGTN